VTAISKRIWTIGSLVLVTGLGFGFKYYRGWSNWWFNDYGAGVMYEIFWCLLFSLIWSNSKHTTRIAVGVLLVTCALEILQLWHGWDFLERTRSTFIGKTLLGTTFVWWDFPHYILGCIVGWLLMRCLTDSDGAAKKTTEECAKL